MAILPFSLINQMRTHLHSDLRFDWKIITLTVVSTLLLMIDYYHRLTPEQVILWDFELPWKAIDRIILYLIIPILIIVFIFREKPSDYGFRLGDWRAGVLITLGGIAIIAPIIWLLGRNNASMHGYYSNQMSMYMPLATFLDLFGWEFIFRGWLLFGYARKFGPDALWLQAVPFALMHIGKPEVETLSTIFGGFAFGWIAYRTRSFIYPFIIHWFIATFIIYVAAGFIG